MNDKGQTMATRIRLRRDDGTPAVRYLCTGAEDVMRRVPLTWVCPDEECARVMEAVFAGRYAESPRSRRPRRLRPLIVQDGIPALAALGVPATVAFRPQRQVPPQRERMAIRAARRRAGAAVMARLFEMVPE